MPTHAKVCACEAILLYPCSLESEHIASITHMPVSLPAPYLVVEEGARDGVPDVFLLCHALVHDCDALGVGVLASSAGRRTPERMTGVRQTPGTSAQSARTHQHLQLSRAAAAAYLWS